YALGVTLYELLTSKPPFYTGDIVIQIKGKIPPPLTHRRKELRVIGEPVPRVWEETIAACLSKDVAPRPQSVDTFLELLSIPPAPPPSDDQPVAVEAAPVEAAPANTNLIAVVAVVVVLLLAAAGWFFGRGSSTKQGTGMAKVDEAKIRKEAEER